MAAFFLNSKEDLMNQKFTDKEIFIAALWSVVIFTGLCLIYRFFLMQYISLPECLIYKYFHAYCPGCGGTRAFHAILCGKLLSSIYYNSAVLYAVIIVLYYLLSHILFYGRIIKEKWVMKYRSIYVCIGVALLVLNCVFKNFEITVMPG